MRGNLAALGTGAAVGAGAVAWEWLPAPTNTPSLIPAQRDTLVAFLLFAGGTALGLVLGG